MKLLTAGLMACVMLLLVAPAGFAIDVPGDDDMIEVDVTLNCWPVIDEEGGYLPFTVNLSHTSNESITFDVWTEVEIPNGNVIPLQSWEITLEPGQTINRQLARYVPGHAASGQYQFRLHAGNHAELEFVSDGFNFTKVEAD